MSAEIQENIWERETNTLRNRRNEQNQKKPRIIIVDPSSGSALIGQDSPDIRLPYENQKHVDWKI